MSLEDPFFVVKDEVFKALNKTRGLYLRWRELSNTNGAENEWTTTELRNSLRSIEWDLEDLEDTIYILFKETDSKLRRSIFCLYGFLAKTEFTGTLIRLKSKRVAKECPKSYGDKRPSPSTQEKNPDKFRIDNKELSSRRHFIEATRDEVRSMKERMNLNRNRDRDITAHQPLLDNPIETNNNLSNSAILGNSVNFASMATRHSGTKYSKLENALDSPGHYTLDSPSHKFIGENVSIQQRMIQGQDEQLDVISDSIGTLKTVSRQIGVELDEQAVMLDDFGNEMDTTESKLDTTMKKVAKVLHMNNDKRQWTAIIVLSIILLIVIVLFIIL